MSAGRKNINTKKDWNTPPKILNVINEFFDQIDYDPCSNEYSIVNAKKQTFYPESDGMLELWNYKNIYVNPPYSKFGQYSLYDWLKKGYNSHSNYANEILYLIPVATNTKHFKDIIFKYYNAICFLNDTRLKFYNQGIEDKKGAPMACCLVYIGKRENEFMKIFSDLGKCFKIK